MMKSLKHLSILILTLFISLGGNASLRPRSGSLHCSQITSSISSTLSQFPLEKLAKKPKTWRDQYRGFESIAAKDHFFFARIQSAFARGAVSFSRDDFKKLLHIDDSKNANFIQKAYRAADYERIFFVLESAYLKRANDHYIGKDDATSLNFFAKMEFITSLVEVVSSESQAKETLSHLKTILLSQGTDAHTTQSDFKAMSGVFYGDRAFMSRVPQWILAANRNMKMNLSLLVPIANHTLIANFNKNKPEFLQLSELYNVVYDSNFSTVNQTLKKGRTHFDASSGTSLLPEVQKEIDKIFHLAPKLMKILSRSPELTSYPQELNISYPSETLFELLRAIAPVERISESRKENDILYYENIQRYLSHKFNIEISTEETMMVVEVFHLLQDVIPRLPLIRTNPIEVHIAEEKTVFSFDFKNAGGLELSQVFKQLVASQNQEGSNVFEFIQKGVDETTQLMDQWSDEIRRSLFRSFPKIEINFQRTGDDIVAILSKTPSPQDMTKFRRAISDSKFVDSHSRVTIGRFSPEESIQDEIGKSEKLEKEIYRTYYGLSSEKIPSLWISRIHSDGSLFHVEAGGPLTPQQTYLLKEILSSLSRSHGSSIKLVTP